LSRSIAEGHWLLDHVTDAFIEAWGPTFERALAQAGLGLLETIADLDNVTPSDTREIHVSGHDELELVYNWLEELLLSFEIRRMIFSRFDIDKITKKNSSEQLEATAFGEHYDANRHHARVEVKGVTYHEMSVVRRTGRVTVRFLLDL
jgi:SHS2 domain-containing protein